VGVRQRRATAFLHRAPPICLVSFTFGNIIMLHCIFLYFPVFMSCLQRSQYLDHDLELCSIILNSPSLPVPRLSVYFVPSVCVRACMIAWGMCVCGMLSVYVA